MLRWKENNPKRFSNKQGTVLHFCMWLYSLRCFNSVRVIESLQTCRATHHLKEVICTAVKLTDFQMWKLKWKEITAQFAFFFLQQANHFSSCSFILIVKMSPSEAFSHSHPLRPPNHSRTYKSSVSMRMAWNDRLTGAVGLEGTCMESNAMLGTNVYMSFWEVVAPLLASVLRMLFQLCHA